MASVTVTTRQWLEEHGPLAGVGIGLAVTLVLLALNFSLGRAGLVALASGMVEPVGGVLGASIVSIMEPMLPLGLMAGFVIMMMFDTILG